MMNDKNKVKPQLLVIKTEDLIPSSHIDFDLQSPTPVVGNHEAFEEIDAESEYFDKSFTLDEEFVRNFQHQKDIQKQLEQGKSLNLYSEEIESELMTGNTIDDVDAPVKGNIRIC